ncbi:MAG TPA: DedA family protein [Chloroflexota bacterium]|nr:DedA family protein [Chloroflexota bacterium]
MAGLEEHILTFIRHFLSSVGYPGIFVLMAIEGFGIPIPSELTMPFSGFLASSAPGAGKFVLPAVIIIGAAGEVAGGIVAYAVGYYGGRPALERYGHLVLLSPEELERGETWFSRYGDWIVLVTRLLPAIRSFIALPAGVVRMPFWRFLLYGAIGSAIWCTALALIGHALGQNWQNVSTGLRKYDVVIVVVVVALLAFALYKRLTAGRTVAGREQPRTSE